MTEDEALKMALEALEADPLEMVADVDGHMVFLKDKAIISIKEVLSQPESDYERGFIDGMQKQMQSSVDKAVNAMSQRTWVGPEQEPVAWQFMKGSNFRKHRPDDFDDLASDGLPYWKPLYTTPQQRTWVGLTDEEIKAFDTWHDHREEEVGWCNPSEIVAYIEAKLRSKNNG